MKQFWVTNADTMLQYYEMLEAVEKDMKRTLMPTEKEIIFCEFMKAKNIKPSGNTELNKEEFIKELASKGKNILNIDENGYTFIKKKKENEDNG